MQFAKHVTATDEIQRSWQLTLALCVVVLAAIIGTAVLAEHNLAQMSEARVGVAQARLADKSLSNLMAHMLNAETGQRGFLLSGRAIYLQPYYTALTQLRDSRAALSVALSNEPSAVGQLDTLDKAISAKLQELERTITLKSEGRSQEAEELVLAGTGKETMDAVREAASALASRADHRTQQWEIEQTQAIRNNYWTLSISLTLNLILFIGLIQRLRYATAQVRTSRQVMSERNNALSSLLESAAERNAQVSGLSELSRFLQSCVDMEEAVLLLKQQLPLLMKSASGALYLMAPSRDQLHQSFAWGDDPYAEYFEPTECWALRLGQPYQQPAQPGAAACTHLQSGTTPVHANMHCLPLVAHGELMGLLVLDAGVANDERANTENENYRRIALEQVGLSIGNLKLRESLRQQSIRDMPTGLYNRRFLEESAQRELLRASRLQAKGINDGLALLMIDIDHFKLFNDEHGHDVGDQVLNEVAQVLRRQTRGSDVAARYGGEEFTIVLTDMPASLAFERAEQVRAGVEALDLHAAGKALGTVTISIGVAQFPTHGNSVAELLIAADKALYEAKRTGRNRVVIASK
jgi:diguanylate cyclase (GGDEF)-like protein